MERPYARASLAALLLAGIAVPSGVLAQSDPAPLAVAAPAPAFEARAKELVAILSGEGDYTAFFAPSFVARLPETRFAAIRAQIAAAAGPVTGIDAIEATAPYAGTLRVSYRDAIATVQLRVDPAAPHQVIGLLFKGVAAREASLAAVTTAIEGLHGTTGYAFARLGDGAPQLLQSHNAERPFAVGSAFKLVILAELVRATNAGERKWSDTVTLDGQQLPGGIYAVQPKGTQVTLRELAEKMISVSDNSATDILLRTLGREKVEAMLPVVGVRDAAANRPFLSTLEAFKLKYLDGGSYGRRYAALDEAERRALLAGDLARIPLVAIPPEPEGGRKPAMIDDVEWFLTPSDLVRTMDWLRRNTEGPAGGEARAILSHNPGIGPDSAARWRWVGYKGGSEPGVMNMTLLLQAKDGAWYALTGSWNDTDRAVNEGRFAALMGRAAELAAP